MGKNLRCQRVCLNRRRICHFAGSVGFYPRATRYILHPLYPLPGANSGLLLLAPTVGAGGGGMVSARYINASYASSLSGVDGSMASTVAYDEKAAGSTPNSDTNFCIAPPRACCCGSHFITRAGGG